MHPVFTSTTRHEITLDNVKVLNLQMQPLSNEQATKLLAVPRHVILLKRPIEKTDLIGEYYRAILRADILFIYIDPMHLE